MRYRVTCVTKDDQQDRFHRLSHIGIATGENRESPVPLADAIQNLEAGKWSLYIEPHHGERMEVVVATDPSSDAKYLTVEGDQTDRLFTLPSCGQA